MTDPRTIRFLANGGDGSAGSRGSDGWNGGRSDAGARGPHGGNGGDGGKPQSGTSGGQIRVEIRAVTTASGEAVQIQGYAQPVHGARTDVQATLAPNELGSIVTSARGGRGGDGGVGGDGGDGGRGGSGEDATRRRPGGDGAPGGSGGSGGAGTDGAPGGVGGTTTLIVEPGAAWSLMAVEHAAAPARTVAGGAGGKAGMHGSGGGGGPGGDGGSSYSWTTEETYKDSQGNPQTRRHRHSQPSGSPGTSGFAGASPGWPLHAGVEGAPGMFRIVVPGAGGVESTYPCRYDLQVVGFLLREPAGPDADGVLEFGETIEVAGVTLRNAGGMPSPEHHPVEVSIRRGGIVEPGAGSVWMTRSIAPDASAALDEPLRFRIAPPVKPGRGGPHRTGGTVELELFQLGPEPPAGAGRTRFRRPYTLPHVSRAFQASYPVESREGVRNLGSLLRGEGTRWEFSLTNASRAPIGCATARPRALWLVVSVARADCAPEDVLLVADDGRTVPLDARDGGFDGYAVEVLAIEPGATVTVVGHVGFSAKVRPFQGVTLHFTLWIGDVEDHARPRAIQQWDAEIRMEPSGGPRPSADLVLLTHNALTEPAFLAWHALADRLGLSMDTWSLGVNGHLEDPTPLGDGRTLGEALAGRLVVIPNQPFQAAETDRFQLPTDVLCPIQVHDFLTRRACAFLTVGAKGFATESCMEPDFSGEPRLHEGRFRELVRRLAAPAPSSGEDGEAEDEGNVSVDAFALTFPFLRPGVARLKRRAKTWSRRLARRMPARRFYVAAVPLPAPERAGSLLGLVPRWKLGSVLVRRSLDVPRSGLLALTASDGEMRDPAFVSGPVVCFAVLCGLPFARKLALLGRLASEAGDTRAAEAVAPLLVRAILADVAAEQAAWRSRGARASAAARYHEESVTAELLRACADGEFDEETCLHLLAGARVIAQTAARWWMLWGKSRATYRVTRRAVKRAFARVLRRAVAPPAAVRARLAEHCERWKEQVRAFRAEKRASGTKRSWAQAAHGCFASPALVGNRLERASDSARTFDGRTWTDAELRQKVATRAAFAAGSAERISAARTLRESFLRSGPPWA